MYSAVLVALGAVFVAYGAGPVGSLLAVALVAAVAAFWEVRVPRRAAWPLQQRWARSLGLRLATYLAAVALVVPLTFLASSRSEGCDSVTYECDLGALDGVIWGFGSFLLVMFVISSVELQLFRRRNRARALAPRPVEHR
jgi:hypothetical protein